VPSTTLNFARWDVNITASGRRQVAIASFERVLDIDPAQPETYQILAPLYEAQGQHERAEWCRTQARLIRQALAALGQP
jgi:Tfp pilus assembly protein PilF